MLHGSIIGSMFTAIRLFSGYMLTWSRDVTLVDLQILAKYPVHGIILNVIPYIQRL
jgi:hypothetical protein